MSPLTLIFPWPPSVNRLWRSVLIGGKVRTLLSKEGRDYSEEVWAIVKKKTGPKAEKLLGEVYVDIYASPPDSRRRDLDNILKSVFDSMTKAGVWADDSQVGEIRIQRGPKTEGGMVRVIVGNR